MVEGPPYGKYPCRAKHFQFMGRIEEGVEGVVPSVQHRVGCKSGLEEAEANGYHWRVCEGDHISVA